MLNNTNIVGYIALLMIAGSYFGGNAGAVEPSSLKSNTAERHKKEIDQKTIILYLDGKRYEAVLAPTEKTLEY